MPHVRGVYRAVDAGGETPARDRGVPSRRGEGRHVPLCLVHGVDEGVAHLEVDDALAWFVSTSHS